MADVQKPTEVPAAAPAVATEPVVAETTAPVATTTTTDATPETTPAVEAAKTDDVPAAEEANAEEEVAAAPVAEEKKAEPVEAGVLEHKGSPASFPKNIMYSKNFFYFGNEPVAAEKLSAYQKGEKVGEVAQHVISWAAHTGKGLLFIAKDGDKSTPVGAIQLAEASEPATDGTNKFHFTAKGHKHTFKASSAAERDSWVDQLKTKIAEAKELAATVTESEAYKSTLESFQPAKKETVAEPTKEVDVTEVKNDETVAPIPVIEEPVTEAKSDEAVKEEIKKEEPKRRSASRKRNSLFGNLLGGKKDDAKKEETKEEIKPETAVVAEDVKPEVAATEPASETPAVASTETPVVATEVTAEAPAAVEKTEAPVKPVPTKRSSIFGGSFFGKKKLESDSTPVSPSTETAPVTESAAPVAENAPVIPAVETSAPLSAEVSSPATVPTEATEAAPATAPIETRPQMKSDKRKSSLPFLSKKEKTASSDEEGDKPKGGYFSKLRQTVKGKKTVEKPAEDKTVEEAAVAPAPEAVKTEETPVVEAAKADEVKADEAVVAAPATESAPVAEKPATTIAPVTAAA